MVDAPDSSIVSSQDIDSLLGALVCATVDIPENFEVYRSEDGRLSWATGEGGGRGDRGGGIYWLSIGRAR
jgi:hypothetical protein